MAITEIMKTDNNVKFFLIITIIFMKNKILKLYESLLRSMMLRPDQTNQKKRVEKIDSYSFPFDSLQPQYRCSPRNPYNLTGWTCIHIRHIRSGRPTGKVVNTGIKVAIPTP